MLGFNTPFNFSIYDSTSQTWTTTPSPLLANHWNVSMCQSLVTGNVYAYGGVVSRRTRMGLRRTLIMTAAFMNGHLSPEIGLG